MSDCNGRVSIPSSDNTNYNYIKEPASNKKYYTEITKSTCDTNINCNIEITPLMLAYFSDQNINIIQNAIKKGVYNKSQKTIDKQDVTEIKIIMRSVYLQHCFNQEKNVTQQINELNNIVIEYCVKTVYNALKGYYNYCKDSCNLAVPPENPILYNTKVNTLELKPWF